jgi:hypothetical protein
MSDVHLRILRAAAKTRARQLQDDQPTHSDSPAPAAAAGRQGELQRLASRARHQLATASARRRQHGDG